MRTLALEAKNDIQLLRAWAGAARDVSEQYVHRNSAHRAVDLAIEAVEIRKDIFDNGPGIVGDEEHFRDALTSLLQMAAAADNLEEEQIRKLTLLVARYREEFAAMHLQVPTEKRKGQIPVSDTEQTTQNRLESPIIANKQLYEAACVFCLFATSIKPEDGRELASEDAKRREALIADGMATLKLAVRNGWGDFAQMQQDPDLELLRDLPEFRALIPPDALLKSAPDM